VKHQDARDDGCSPNHCSDFPMMSAMAMNTDAM
jgi:hypothetical protein